MGGRHRSAAEVRLLKAHLRSLIMRGASEYEQLQELNVRLDDLRWLRGELQKDELQVLAGEDPKESFFAYKLRMEGIMGDLDEVIEEARLHPEGYKHHAVIGAAQAKRNIVNDIMSRGQDMGVIHREPTKTQHTLVGGIAIADLTNSELTEKIRERAARLEGMLALSTPYADEDDGDIYREDPAAEVIEVEAAPPRRKVL